MRQPDGSAHRLCLPGRLRPHHRDQGAADRAARARQFRRRRPVRTRSPAARAAGVRALRLRHCRQLRSVRSRRGRPHGPARGAGPTHRDFNPRRQLYRRQRPRRALGLRTLERQCHRRLDPRRPHFGRIRHRPQRRRSGLCRPGHGRREIRPGKLRPAFQAHRPESAGRGSRGARLLQLCRPRDGQLQPPALRRFDDDARPRRLESRPSHHRRTGPVGPGTARKHPRDRRPRRPAQRPHRPQHRQRDDRSLRGQVTDP